MADSQRTLVKMKNGSVLELIEGDGGTLVGEGVDRRLWEAQREAHTHEWVLGPPCIGTGHRRRVCACGLEQT